MGEFYEVIINKMSYTLQLAFLMNRTAGHLVHIFGIVP